MRKAIFITVRSASTRLPEKCYREINNKPTIQYVIEQDIINQDVRKLQKNTKNFKIYLLSTMIETLISLISKRTNI